VQVVKNHKELAETEILAMFVLGLILAVGNPLFIHKF